MQHKIKQIRYEIESWKRLLNFLMEENICLKNRLTETEVGTGSYIKLEILESFQDRFIKNDEIIRLMRNEIVEIASLLKGEIWNETGICRKLKLKLELFRTEVVRVEIDFWRLKFDFNVNLVELN
jgi:hypothetical protein